MGTSSTIEGLQDLNDKQPPGNPSGYRGIQPHIWDQWGVNGMKLGLAAIQKLVNAFIMYISIYEYVYIIYIYLCTFNVNIYNICIYIYIYNIPR